MSTEKNPPKPGEYWHTEYRTQSKRFAFYSAVMTPVGSLGRLIFGSLRIADDEANSDDFPARCTAAQKVAERLAKEGQRVLVALYDPQRPHEIEPVYFVSPWRSKEAREVLAKAVHWSEEYEGPSLKCDWCGADGKDIGRGEYGPVRNIHCTKCAHEWPYIPPDHRPNHLIMEDFAEAIRFIAKHSQASEQ